MILKKGKKMLLVRYSDYLYSNCISDHLDVLKDKGYCWFGKVGKQKPSQHFCKIVLDDENPMIILHSAKSAFVCRLDDIVFELPKDGIYPSYYNTVLFEKGNKPSAYFKLTNCIQIEKSVLSSFIVSSSRNLLPNALRSSMNSIFLVECSKDVEVEGVNE